MRTLLYRVGQEPVDYDAEIPDFAAVIGAPEIEWMTVRFLKLCIVRDSRGADSGKPVCQVLGKTPIYGDFLVTLMDWDDEGNTWASPINDGFASMVKHMLFNHEYGKKAEGKDSHGND